MTISAVLLAGGKSRRMGQDKATMRLRDRPLWQTQLDLLHKLQPEQILVSAQIDPRWRPSDVGFVADSPPSRGPLSGIAATLSRITSEHLLVLAIDTPFITETYLRKLCAQVRSGRGIVPMLENRAEALAAIYPREAAPEFAQALSSTNFSLQPLVQNLIAIGKLRAIEVLQEERPLFRNLNEPGDLTDA
jgi:molybdopterin-guanine dinucleotide biosynthesis protein A